MEKLLTEILDYNISGDLFSNKNITSPVIEFSAKKTVTPKTLAQCVQYFSKINDIENDLCGICFGFDNIVINDELSDSKVRHIALELAKAVDCNSVDRIKQIKYEFGDDIEFATAKDFLNKKCKEVWNVFEPQNTSVKIPYEAMKALGITNRPSLKFLLGDSLQFFEKDNGNSTADIITSILKNKHLSYTMSDIHKFLRTTAIKQDCKYNFRTAAYLISEQGYDEIKLKELGIEKAIIEKSLSELSVKVKLKYYWRNYKFKISKIPAVLQQSINNLKSFRNI